MSQNKTASDRLKSTLNELDFAIEQGDSLTNKPQGEQVPSETLIQKKTKTLLKELRDQIDEFETIEQAPRTEPTATDKVTHSS